MSSAVAELDAYLQSMLNLKPPGVSGSKISSITSLCTANVQSESVLIQKIYTHFKKAPGTHKLGVLYVVDSVTRQWVDQARKAGQTLGSGASDGTFAAGVNRVTELLPVLLNDIIANAPEDQKAKIEKLLDIWERGNTFPSAMLSSIKERLKSSANNTSTTPDKSPAPGFIPLGQQAPEPPKSAPTDTSAILAALTNMAKQNTAAPITSGTPAQASVNNVLGAHNAFSQMPPSTVDPAAQTNGQNVNPLGALLAGYSNAGPNQGQTPPAPPVNVPQNPFATLLPQSQPQALVPPPVGGVDPARQLQLLQALQAQGVPQDQWATALHLLSLTSANAPNTNMGGMPNLSAASQVQNSWGGRNEPSRDDYTRSPQYRRRSRSPGWDRRREQSPPRRRDSPVYGEYRASSPNRNRDGDRGRGGGYRQRSPAGRRGGRRSATPPREQTLPPPGPKIIEFDPSLGPGMIKVLSRTLFVGGVTTSDSHLRSIFSNFGIVQTCIVNLEKRHAFVKMMTRRDAESARDGMEQYKAGEMQLRTRWGVGFGPRDCSDYQTGISIIPIDRLTDADRKWMLTAEYGGTGGRSIEPGMVVEEPDIEIGAGVSSKAISRRMATDTGGKRGPQSSRTDPVRGYGRDNNRQDYGNGNRYNDRDMRDGHQGNNNGNMGVAPPVPGFGFNFSGIPNMSMFPANFLNAAGTPQPPPPGQ